MKLKMSDLNATSNITICDTGMYKVRPESDEVVIQAERAKRARLDGYEGWILW